MTLLRLGPYRIVKPLGTGAMGTVYLAEDEDRRVALKVLHPHLMERRGFFERFQREASLGQKVVHPNVVATLDCDMFLEGETLYCCHVMEYVEGRTLRELLREYGTVPEALLREIAAQIAAGLEAIHAEGIVHRDLKPENALITDDRRLRIMDLGIAKAHEESTAITQEGQFAGSLPYAAPEQIRRREVGPATDLYALGVLLYELATGANPFRHDDPGAVIHAHLNTIPPRANERDADLSPFFAELVATLLAKEPGQRFADAPSLISALREAEAGDWWTERERLQRRGDRPRIRVRRETAVYGRDDDLRDLRRRWEAARTGEGGAVIVRGEAGIGKTRLVDAFCATLDDEDAHVLYGSYPPSGSSGGLTDALIAKFGAGGLEETLRPYLAATASLIPSLAALLRHEPAPEGAPPLAGDALHAVFCHLMRALAAEKPLVWIVEDLHFAPPESRQLLVSLTRAVAGHRALILGTTRGKPAETAGLPRIRLGRLSPREVVRLLRDAFGSDALADKLGGRIAYKSDGVPFFVFEMIRGLKEGQFVTELPDGTFVETREVENIEVPSAIRDLIEVRLGDLSRDERSIVDVGAVMGYEFDPDLVARVLERGRFEVLQDLADIERRSGVIRSEGRNYRFDHHQIQEVVYEDLPQALREECHSRLARTLGDGKSDRDAALAATHHLRGTTPEAAIDLLDRAFGHFERTYQHDAALDLSARALMLDLAPETRISVLLTRADVLTIGDHRLDEQAALDEAYALAQRAREKPLQCKALQRLGWHCTRFGRYTDARKYIERALELAAGLGLTSEEARMHQILGSALGRLGAVDEAERHFLRAQDLYESIGDAEQRACNVSNLAGICWRRGQLAEAVEKGEEALAATHACGKRIEEVHALANLGTYRSACGDLGAARDCYEAARTLARDLGYRRGESQTTVSLALVLRKQGRFRESRQALESTSRIAREVGDRRSEALAATNLGVLLRTRGLYGPALANERVTLAYARERGERAYEVVSLEHLGWIDAELGDLDRAERDFQDALAVARDTKHREAEACALRGMGHVATERRRFASAMELLGESAQILTEVGKRNELAMTHYYLGRALAAKGESDAAEEWLRRALDVAGELRNLDLELLVTIDRVRLESTDSGQLEARLAASRVLVSCRTRTLAHRTLALYGGDAAHARRAQRLAAHMQRHAPAEYVDRIFEIYSTARSAST